MILLFFREVKINCIVGLVCLCLFVVVFWRRIYRRRKCWWAYLTVICALLWLESIIGVPPIVRLGTGRIMWLKRWLAEVGSPGCGAKPGVIGSVLISTGLLTAAGEEDSVSSLFAAPFAFFRKNQRRLLMRFRSRKFILRLNQSVTFRSTIQDRGTRVRQTSLNQIIRWKVSPLTDNLMRWHRVPWFRTSPKAKKTVVKILANIFYFFNIS